VDGYAARLARTVSPIYPPMQIPTLETSRLRLLPPSSECAAAYERFYTDESASKAYGGPISPGAAWSRLASDLGSWYLQGFGVWAVQRKLEQDIVGTCGFWQGKGWPRELTWWLLPEVRGQGLAKEASLAAVNHAYSMFGWAEVQTYMNDENEAARSLVLALGGVKLGRQGFPDGNHRDLFRIPPPTAP
jgi:ribosomal-protein-alanine N-acetyltransferase